MMNKWLAFKLFRQLPLVVFLVLSITAGYAIAQSEQYDYPLSLPPVSYNVDIELDNVFQSELSQHDADQRKLGSLDTPTPEPIQLVGILIMGEKKLAWIKTNDNALIELENGEQVPGSRFRVEQIFVDSIVLVNIETCPQNSHCKPMLELDLNR